MADRALQKIRHNASKLDMPCLIQDDDIRLARFAALLHDVGHKPFSHALDGLSDSHEDYSAAFVMKRFSEPILESKIEPRQVADLIKGKADPEKPFLASLISGQMDVDRFDYLLRDSYYAGVKYGIFDLDRLLDSLVVKGGRLLLLGDGLFSGEQMLYARYQMFGQVYLHKTKRAFEGMAVNVARDLYRQKRLCYPAVRDFDEPTFEHFVEYDDAWFLNAIGATDKPVLKNVVRDIKRRIPYKEASNSEAIRRKTNSDEPGSHIGFHRAIESSVKANLDSIGIDENEIVFDQSASLPYKLQPYSVLGDQGDKYADTVLVYDRKTDAIEPIEKRSGIVRALAGYFTVHRMFVAADKKPLLEAYLKENFDYC